MASSIDRMIPVLRREYLFRGLTTGQLVQVASRFHLEAWERDLAVFSEGDEADCFYLILTGKVRVTRRQRDGQDKLLNLLGSGDFFGEQALLFNELRNATVTTVETTELLRMHRDDFQQLVQEFPEIGVNLSATAESRRLVQREKFGWMNADEVIYYLTRKHNMFMVVSMIWPILTLLLSVAVLIFASLQIGNLILYEISMTAGIFLLGGALLWAIWNYLDWENDYYIVTNQRVIWQEKMIGLYDSRRETPLERVQSVDVNSSQIGRIFNYGDVIVRTLTGGIHMRGVNNPTRFASFVEGFKQRVILHSREEEEKAMEQVLDQALQRATQELQPEPGPYTPPVPVSLKPKRPPRPPRRSFRERWDDTFKVRYEKNGVITYRKHWWLLVRKAWQPVVLLIVLQVGMGYIGWRALVAGLSPTMLWLALGLALAAFLVLFIWLGYYILDWTNDIYRLTPEQLLDIERKPLGQEIKKTTNLESVQSIEHERENLLGILFNFGTVTIKVGSDASFLFRGVYNPDQVHEDISDYRDALMRRKIQKDTESERNRMVHWLVAFHKAEDRFNEHQRLKEQEKQAELENQDDVPPVSG